MASSAEPGQRNQRPSAEAPVFIPRNGPNSQPQMTTADQPDASSSLKNSLLNGALPVAPMQNIDHFESSAESSSLGATNGSTFNNQQGTSAPADSLNNGTTYNQSANNEAVSHVANGHQGPNGASLPVSHVANGYHEPNGAALPITQHLGVGPHEDTHINNTVGHTLDWRYLYDDAGNLWHSFAGLLGYRNFNELYLNAIGISLFLLEFNGGPRNFGYVEGDVPAEHLYGYAVAADYPDPSMLPSDSGQDLLHATFTANNNSLGSGDIVNGEMQSRGPSETLPPAENRPQSAVPKAPLEVESQSGLTYNSIEQTRQSEQNGPSRVQVFSPLQHLSHSETPEQGPSHGPTAGVELSQEQDPRSSSDGTNGFADSKLVFEVGTSPATPPHINTARAIGTAGFRPHSHPRRPLSPSKRVSNAVQAEHPARMEQPGTQNPLPQGQRPNQSQPVKAESSNAAAVQIPIQPTQRNHQSAVPRVVSDPFELILRRIRQVADETEAAANRTKRAFDARSVNHLNDYYSSDMQYPPVSSHPASRFRLGQAPAPTSFGAVGDGRPVTRKKAAAFQQASEAAATLLNGSTVLGRTIADRAEETGKGSACLLEWPEFYAPKFYVAVLPREVERKYEKLFAELKEKARKMSE